MLALDKLADVAQLENLLALDKLTDAAQLVTGASQGIGKVTVRPRKCIRVAGNNDPS